MCVTIIQLEKKHIYILINIQKITLTEKNMIKKMVKIIIRLLII